MSSGRGVCVCVYGRGGGGLGMQWGGGGGGGRRARAHVLFCFLFLCSFFFVCFFPYRQGYSRYFVLQLFIVLFMFCFCCYLWWRQIHGKIIYMHGIFCITCMAYSVLLRPLAKRLSVNRRRPWRPCEAFTSRVGDAGIVPYFPLLLLVPYFPLLLPSSPTFPCCYHRPLLSLVATIVPYLLLPS